MPRILGDLQLAIMRVLWRGGEATVAEVHQALREERGLAPTTIATMLRKMEGRGLVRHRVQGRVFVYRAGVDEEEVHRSMVEELVHRLFEGDAQALVSHLVSQGEIDLEELEELRQRLREAEERKRERRP